MRILALLLTGCALDTGAVCFAPGAAGGALVPVPCETAEVRFDLGGTWTPYTISDDYCGSDGLDVIDFDGDGALDVLGGWECAGTTGMGAVTLHRRWRQTPLITMATGIEGVRACDVTADGRLDAIVVGETGSAVLCIGSVDLETWTCGVLAGSSVSDRWLTIACGDMDGDTDVDLVMGGETSRIALWSNPGATASDPATWTRADIYLASKSAMRIYTDDLDGDSDLDLFVSQRYRLPGAPLAGRVYWLENGAAWAEHVIHADERGMIACRGDIDGDMDVDYLVPYEGQQGAGIQPRLAWYERGAGWAEHVIALPPALLTRTLKGCDLADADGDGDLDIALTAFGGPQLVWVWDGTTWSPVTPASYGQKYEEPRWADVDGVLPLDLVLSEEQQGRGLFWLRGM